MPKSFINFKALRRRSRTSIRTDASTDTSSNEDHSSQTTTPTVGTVTPSSIAAQSDPALNASASLNEDDQPEEMGEFFSKMADKVKRRPSLMHSSGSNSSASSKRHSFHGMGSAPTNGSPNPLQPNQPNQSNQSNRPRLGPYTPWILNTRNGEYYGQKVLLVHGRIGPEHERRLLNGFVTIIREDDVFPALSWPVERSRFKGLVTLTPGYNAFRLEFTSPQIRAKETGHFNVNMTPSKNTPLQLAIVVCKDSPETFDAHPSRVATEGNDIDVATRKFRTAAYLWQAHIAEHMSRHGFRNTTITFEEEWTTGTTYVRDRDMAEMRYEARVDILRIDKTVAELREMGGKKLDCCETNPEESELFNVIADAARKRYRLDPGQKRHIAAIILDAKWDQESGTVLGHEGLGGSSGEDIGLAIFGSHFLHSYPFYFDDLVQTFVDRRPVDPAYVASFTDPPLPTWEAIGLGMGGHLHQLGHMFGSTRRPKGIMSGDFHGFSKSFTPPRVHEGIPENSVPSGRQHDDVCVWHTLDCINFIAHPCFRPYITMRQDNSVQAFAGEGDEVIVSAKTGGIRCIEIYPGTEKICKTWNEYSGTEKRVNLSLAQLKSKLPDEAKKASKIRVSIKTRCGGSLDIDDFQAFSKNTLKLPSNKTGYRGNMLGLSRVEGSTPQEIIFNNVADQKRILSRIIVHHKDAVMGLEFVWEDRTTQLFGVRGEQPGDVFELRHREAEYITGFIVRSGHWIDGIQIMTSIRQSPIYGSRFGGSPKTLIPPQSYKIAGLSGTCGAWIDGLSLILARH